MKSKEGKIFLRDAEAWQDICIFVAVVSKILRQKKGKKNWEENKSEEEREKEEENEAPSTSAAFAAAAADHGNWYNWGEKKRGLSLSPHLSPSLSLFFQMLLSRKEVWMIRSIDNKVTKSLQK